MYNNMNMKKKILVIATHPDDEINCGGAVALHTKAGDKVTTIVVCEGESLRYGGVGEIQGAEMKKAAGIFGVKDVRYLKFPDQKLEKYLLTDIIDPILKIVREVKPEIVYMQYGGDINRDHRIVAEAAMVATRPTEKFIKEVYAFYTASSTEWAYPRHFIPDTWIDISKTIDKKLKAMSCYKSEQRDYPHPRSLEAMRNSAKVFGNQVCMEYAEVYMTIRRVTRK